MILAIDIGNTNIVLGCIDQDRCVFVERLSTVRTKTELEYAIDIKNVLDIYHIRRNELEGGIISSVVPQITTIVKMAVEKILKREALVVGAGIRTGLNIRIDNPAQLGADLVAGAVGAIEKYPLPCLVLDMGTATKISVIDSKGSYRGCTISAGIKISLDALSSGASQLPSIPLNAPKSAIGTNTVSSMQSGTILGAAAMIEGLCARLEKALGEEVKTIVATGGIAGFIIKHCNMDAVYDPDLILDGLRFIYKKNTY